MFPKSHHEASAAHNANMHTHFDLGLAGMSLEGWLVVFVLFAALQARPARPRVRPTARNARPPTTAPADACAAPCAQFVRAWRMYDRLIAKQQNKE